MIPYCTSSFLRQNSHLALIVEDILETFLSEGSPSRVRRQR
jgi:hypothetical protein